MDKYSLSFCKNDAHSYHISRHICEAPKKSTKYTVNVFKGKGKLYVQFGF